ncbi:MAG: hypothetical protein FD128_2463, partial [Hyphomonadaceae bacterium]
AKIVVGARKLHSMVKIVETALGCAIVNMAGSHRINYLGYQ